MPSRTKLRYLEQRIECICDEMEKSFNNHSLKLKQLRYRLRQYRAGYYGRRYNQRQEHIR